MAVIVINILFLFCFVCVMPPTVVSGRQPLAMLQATAPTQPPAKGGAKSKPARSTLFTMDGKDDFSHQNQLAVSTSCVWVNLVLVFVLLLWKFPSKFVVC